MRLFVLVPLEILVALNSKTSATGTNRKRECVDKQKHVVPVDPDIVCWLDDRLLV